MARIGGNPRDMQSPSQASTIPQVDSLETYMLPDSSMEPQQAPQDFTVDFGGQQAPPASYKMVNGQLVEDMDQPIASADDDNIALLMDDDELLKIGRRIVEDVDRDETERGPWRRRFENGLAMMGLIEDDLDDGVFPGASNVIHPLLAEAITQFWARALGEFFPPEGPAKGKVYGQQTKELLDRASRVAEYLNYEMTEEDEGYIEESSRLLFNLPISGNAFRKTFKDPILGHSVGIFVSVDDLIVPAETTSLYTTSRFTHRMKKHPNEVKRLMHTGFYRKVDLMSPQPGEENEVDNLKNETSDVAPDGDNEDAVYEIYESCVELDLDVDPFMDENGERIDLPRSYYVTVEKASNQVLSIRRGWKKDDPTCRRRVMFQKYGFVPGFGFYDFGLLHLIGGLQGAATGALRVLLDSAASASLSGGFVAADSGIKGDSITITPGEWRKVKANGIDLKNSFFPAPVRDPSPALFNLLGLLIDGGKSFSATTEAMTGQGDGKNIAVGTITKLIEQGEKVMSTIHRLAFKSLQKELKTRFELAKEDVPTEGYPYEVGGDGRTVYAQDFGPGVGVTPVADPNIFSSGQRMAIAQMVYETSMANPDVVPKKKAIKRLYEAARVPDIDDLIPEDVQPQPYDPAGEVQAILLGKAVLVVPEQPHVDHLKVLWAFASNPQFGANPQVQAQVGPSLISVIGQHLAYAWVTASRQMGVQAGYMDPETGQVQQPPVPPEQLAAAMAQIAPSLVQAPGLPAMQQDGEGGDDAGKAKLMEVQGKLEAKRQEMDMKREEHEFDMQAAMQKLQVEIETVHAKLDAQKQELQQKAELRQIEGAVKVQAVQQKAETDARIADQQAAQQQDQMARQAQMDEQRQAVEMDGMQREAAMKEQQQAMDMMAPEPAPAAAPAAKPRRRRGAQNGPV